VGELDLAISDYSVALELDMRNGGNNENEAKQDFNSEEEFYDDDDEKQQLGDEES